MQKSDMTHFLFDDFFNSLSAGSLRDHLPQVRIETMESFSCPIAIRKMSADEEIIRMLRTRRHKKNLPSPEWGRGFVLFNPRWSVFPTFIISELSYAFHKPCRLQYSLAVT